MRKKNSIWLLFMFVGVHVVATGQQTNEEEAIASIISRLFKGLELGDSAMVHSTFTNRAELVSIYRDKNQEATLDQNTGPLQNFLIAVGTSHKEIWHEEIWDLKIQVDGDLAHAWCKYAFYLGNKFSHCGVDSFHFFKGKEGWKIFHLADTRRNTDCQIPQEIKLKYP